ncbi:MAG: hypothetical protein ACLFQE_08015 [Thermotogota bacterium]
MSALSANRFGWMKPIDPEMAAFMNSMTFNDLLLGFHYVFISTLETVKKHYESAVRRRNEIRIEGRTNATFLIPLPGTEERYQPVSLPLSSFFTDHFPSIPMIKFEFECDVKRRIFSKNKWDYVLQIPRYRKKQISRRKPRHLVQVVFTCREMITAEVYFDGAPFCDISNFSFSHDHPQEEKVNMFTIRGLVHILRQFWKPKGYLFSNTQAGKVEEILHREKKVKEQVRC